MIQQIIVAYENTILQTPWLSNSSKAIAIDKIRNIIIRVAEPDEWTVEPFADRISADRYDHNMNMVRRYRVQRNLQLWHKDKPDSLDRNAISFFAMPLTDVNAYYSGPSNTITVLAGILQPPFYSHDFNKVSKYATLGFVIGHELGHATDQHGLYWDRDGSFVMDGIYDEMDMHKFVKQADCVVREFSPGPSVCDEKVSGSYGNATLNEDLADKTGAQIAYDALFQEGEGSIGDKQTFFTVLAQAWCASYDRNHTCARVASDVHALPSLRVDNTLRDMPEFHAAFSCAIGQHMYRPQDQICKVY